MRAATITAHGRAPEVLDRADPVPGPGELLVAVTAVPITPLDLLCASGTSYFGAPALPYVPGVQAVGVVRDGPPELVGRRVWFPTTAGMAPGDGGLAELAVAAAAEAVVVDADLPDTAGGRARRSRPSPPGRCSRAGPRSAPGRPCSSSAPAGSSARSPCRRPACSAPAASSRRPARPTRWHRATARGADAVVDLRADDDPATLAERLREACQGAADVVVDPLAGIPGTAAALVLAEGGRLVNLGSTAGPALSVDSAALRSRSAAVLGYTNTALTDAPPTGGLRHGPRPRRARSDRGRPRRRPARRAHRRRGTRSAVARHPGGSWSAPSPTGDDATTGRTCGPAPPSRVVPQRRRRSVPVTVWPVFGTVTVTV